MLPILSISKSAICLASLLVIQVAIPASSSPVLLKEASSIMSIFVVLLAPRLKKPSGVDNPI